MKRQARRGFTLIELIGVLAVIAILAASILPNVIRQINNAVRDAESNALASMADALIAGALQHRYIPGNGTDVYDATGALGANGVEDWVDLVAEQMNLSAANVVNEENRTCARRYWFDPANGAGTLLNAAVDTDGNGTYQQDVDTLPTIPPINARAMIVSDISDGCSNNIATPTGAAAFNGTWDQTGAGGGLTESASLYVQRVNFTQYFERITLVNSAATLFGRESFSSTALPVALAQVVLLPANVTVSSIYVNASLVSTNGSTAFNLDVGNDGIAATLMPVTNMTLAASVPYNNAALAVANVLIVQVNIAAIVPPPTPPAPNNVNGYVDVTVGYAATPYYRVIGTAADVVLTIAPSNTTIYLMNGSELQLKDQDPVVGTRATLHTLVAKDADSFVFTPGPPAMWGR